MTESFENENMENTNPEGVTPQATNENEIQAASI